MTAGNLCQWGVATTALPSVARHRSGVQSERREAAVAHGAPGGFGKSSRYAGVVREGGLCSYAGRCAVADRAVGARV